MMNYGNIGCDNNAKENNSVKMYTVNRFHFTAI